MRKPVLSDWAEHHRVADDLRNEADQPFVRELGPPARFYRDETALTECMRKYAALLLALMFALQGAQAVTPAPRMTGESLLKRLESVDPATVPWTQDSNISREELAYLHTVTNVEYVQGYVAALYDATEGKAWCYSTKYKVPKPDTFWDESRWGLNRLPPSHLKRNAADLLVEIWREKWPCLPKGGAEMNVPFATVKMHFPDRLNVSAEELYHWIGYPENIGNDNFANTCAIRLSLALLGAGFPNPGIWPVKAGKHKNRMIETKQRRLSNWLVRHLGQPEKFKSGHEAKSRIGSRNGIISFFQLNGPTDNQGHIDIDMMDRWGAYLRCNNDNRDQGSCYWGAVEIWFWPLR